MIATTPPNSAWTALHVEVVTVRDAVRAVHLPAPRGVRLGLHLGGPLVLGDAAVPAGEHGVYRPDQICVTPPGVDRVIGYRPRSGPVDLALVTVPDEFFAEYARSRPGGSAVDVGALEAVGRPDPVVTAVVATVLDAWRSGAGGGYAEAAARYLVAHLVESHERVTGGATGDGDGIAGVLAHLRAHVAEPITLRDMAARTPHDRFRFLRLFTEATGTTPHRYLLGLRMDLARHLLETGADPVAEVARRCGFPSPEHFSRTFHRHFGTTPTRCRKDAQRALDNIRHESRNSRHDRTGEPGGRAE
ncbi:AraC family transcriptional regulator [Umezawaea beigongshangensis]|uniref:AraC family transcriptional regulator n=1 Tax=Umezawaea beigongshangensis TaxID=2780383 RepID=UPI0018F14D8F|nr:AraC family transcriptional regulator [Umezawaea beigongshangensis]